MITRKEYIDNSSKDFDSDRGSNAHHTYYSQFVTNGVKHVIESHFSKDKLLAAYKEDKHFNTIPLLAWDNLELFIKANVSSTLLKETKEYWSLSTSVCIAKAAARLLIEK